MDTVLKGYERKETGTRASQKLRNEEKIPAVLYGKDTKNTNFYIEKQEVEKLLRRQERLLNLSIGKGDPVPTLIQDIQYEPIKGDMLHIDFLKVSLDEKIEVDVPVELRGSELSPGVQEGGNLETVLHEITVLCFPDRIPESLSLDVSGMGIGEVKTVSELEQVEEVEILTDAEEIVASVHEPVDVEAATDLEESLQEIEAGEPTVQKQKEPEEIETKEAENADRKQQE